ncbi:MULTISPECIES: hypothetical protein [unclassified Janthinobacterium]|uniref:hypothetical protein n=1 Tax=unclassified Janthinobacterium TaxID=2610881 RepID=UPI001E436735|nr:MULTISPECIES: hypothetical protein [unclassified Janthinobacterium]MCC7643659.1 hypothetical protein [Janthinobacterium sp. EB271-G4-3-1]MCC7691373.1 hypothetical protein [Janthinobacterium sp. EB271-G4-3-2]
MKHTDTIALQGSIADMRLRIATEQAAMHKVRLGVARWSSALAPQDEDATSSPASQTHWHAEAQCHFMCWLELGGFAHPDADAVAETGNVTAPVMVDTAPEISSGANASAGAAPARQADALPAHCNGCVV